MKPIRVLLADDHRMVADGLSRLLSREFELAGVVTSGEKLLKAARELRPDVIVSDISMPGMTGLDALARLRAEDPAAKVVLLTMHDNIAYAREALQAGAMGYVLKQSAAEELIMAVRAAIAGHTFVSPEMASKVFRSVGQGAEPADPLENLSLRQREVLRLLADGCSAKTIAARLDISPRTVESHKYKIMQTLNIASNAELIRFAVRNGLVG
jgi:DNA-binding NarL/FixJ family response regulator